MVVFSMLVNAKPEKREELVHALTLIAQRVRTAPGCLGCDFSRSFEDQYAFRWTEEWESESELEKHKESSDFHMLMGIRFLLTHPPIIKTDHIQERDVHSMKQSVKEG